MVTPAVAASVGQVVEESGARLVVVMGHTHCAAADAAIDAWLEAHSSPAPWPWATRPAGAQQPLDTAPGGPTWPLPAAAPVRSLRPLPCQQCLSWRDACGACHCASPLTLGPAGRRAAACGRSAWWSRLAPADAGPGAQPEASRCHQCLLAICMRRLALSIGMRGIALCDRVGMGSMH